MEQKAKTRALLAAFGCALTYLLAGKVLAFLPAPAWDVRALSFVHHCIAAPVVEELVFRGAIQQLAQPKGCASCPWADGRPRRCRRYCLRCSTAPRRAWRGRLAAALCWAHFVNAPAGYGRGCFCIH